MKNIYANLISFIEQEVYWLKHDKTIKFENQKAYDVFCHLPEQSIGIAVKNNNTHLLNLYVSRDFNNHFTLELIIIGIQKYFKNKEQYAIEVLQNIFTNDNFSIFKNTTIKGEQSDFIIKNQFSFNLSTISILAVQPTILDGK